MLNTRIKKIAKIASIGIILVGSAIGIIVRENKNGSTVNASQLSERDYGSSVAQGGQNLEAEKQVICQNALEEDDNDLAIREYSKTEIVDCSSAGCGGLF